MTTLIEHVRERFPDAVVSSHDWRGDETALAAPRARLATRLRDFATNRHE